MDTTLLKIRTAVYSKKVTITIQNKNRLLNDMMVYTVRYLLPPSVKVMNGDM
jgi:hypothetical protein